MITLLTTAALAAADPCYGHTYEDRATSDHFWVEWQPGALPDEAAAQVILDAAEAAREVYTRDLGYRITDEPIALLVNDRGTGGITLTRECDGVPVPTITLSIDNYDDRALRNVTSHEVAHAVQYAYMGSYSQSVASWLWWMEGHATWMEAQATGRWRDWAGNAQAYVNRPHLALQHGLAGFTDDVVMPHMYGTTYVVHRLATFADPDAVRATWDWGASRTGDIISFPDAISGVGLDFDLLWQDHLAHFPTVEGEPSADLSPPPTVEVVDELPADGSEAGPEGLGIQVVHFPKSLGARNKALRVRFDGDPDVRWHAVLVRTDKGALVDHVVIDVDESGQGQDLLKAFKGVDGWLVVSPQDVEAVQRGWSWSAELVRDRAPDEVSTPPTEGDEPRGCAQVRGASLLGVLLAWLTSRTRSIAAASPARAPRRGR